MDGLGVVGENGVLHVDMVLVLMSVHVVDELVHVSEGNEGVDEGEIGTPRDEEVVAVVEPGGTGANHVGEALGVVLNVVLVARE